MWNLDLEVQIGTEVPARFYETVLEEPPELGGTTWNRTKNKQHEVGTGLGSLI